MAISSREQASAEQAAEKIAAEFSVTARGYGMDYCRVADIQEVFRKVEADFGRLDAFVANASHLGVDYGLMNTKEEDYDAIMDANIKGSFFCCQCAAELMKKTGGSIVTLGSVQGTGAVPGRTVYGMSKAALSILARYMAYELGEFGIRANNVVAGAIHSHRWDELSDEVIAQRRSRYPAGRESTEDEVANAVYFLCSEQAATITGTDLTIDSGTCACLVPYKK